MSNPSTKTHWEKYGNWLMLAVASVAAAASVGSVWVVLHLASAQKLDASADNHTNDLIRVQLSTATDKIESKMDGKAAATDEKLDKLGQRIAGLEGELNHRVNTSVRGIEQGKTLERRADRQVLNSAKASPEGTHSCCQSGAQGDRESWDG